MNQLSTEKRAQVIRCICEGCSIRATVRMTGAGKNTIARLLVDMGTACAEFHDEKVRNLPSQLVQVDEIWSFVGVKERRATPAQKALNMGDAWTWVAIDSDAKLVISWLVGERTEGDCRDFIDDLADRCAKRIQLSSDGLGTYVDAVRLAFGANVDYGQIIKTYGVEVVGEHRYSPPICTGCKTKAVLGDPMDSQISTSFIERQNLTVRMHNRRFTRLTNAFSKKHENHIHAVALHYTFYNFCRPHQTLTEKSGRPGYRTPTTPAMAAKVTDHVWSIEELVGLLG